jgi:SAM-dependent methyltransferase
VSMGVKASSTDQNNGWQVRLLRRWYATPTDHCSGAFYQGKSKLAVLLGEDLFARLRGKTVVDFGCGEGAEAVEMAQRGARRVIGLDIREDVLAVARERARAAGVEAICSFNTKVAEPVDVVVSLDAFEHFADPAAILKMMDSLLHESGEVLASFGPTWFHPYGGHLFSVFPWAHLVFSEPALIAWRAGFKSDGARSFREVPGGLNQMTISRFEKLVAESPLRFASLEPVPIRKLAAWQNGWTREFTTALVRCRLVKNAQRS